MSDQNFTGSLGVGTHIRIGSPPHPVFLTASSTGALYANDVPVGAPSVKDYGAKGDNSTDDTDAIQLALTSGATSVYVPGGTYRVRPNVLTLPSGVRLFGDDRKSSILKKTANGVLLNVSGPSSDPTGATHVRYATIAEIGLQGGSFSGALVQAYYTNNLNLQGVYFSDNADVVIDGVELWDSRFENLVFDSCGGATGTSTPNVWLRNSSASSGFGASSDNVNQVHFRGCRFEAFTTGAIWIQQGTLATNNPNGIYIDDCKMESRNILGGPFLRADSSCVGIAVDKLYCFAGSFGSGFSTAITVINWAAVASSLENVLITNGGTPTVNLGVDLFSADLALLRNVRGRYLTAPVGSHVFFEPSSTGDFMVENVDTNLGTQFSGTIPSKFISGSPLRQVAGAVTDGAFTHLPLNGTLAVDTTNSKLYVRIGGTWKGVVVA